MLNGASGTSHISGISAEIKNGSYDNTVELNQYNGTGLSTKSSNNNSSNPFTSKIRSMFKGVDDKDKEQKLKHKHQQEPQHDLKYVDLTLSSNLASNSRAHPRDTDSNATEKDLHSRQRAKSDLDSPTEVYLPEFLMPSGGGDGRNGKDDWADSSRDRSQSQPQGSLLDDVNPLYKLQYENH